MTNKYTIISQINTLQHVSTLSCHPQGACNQYQVTQVFQMQLLVIKFTIKMFHIGFMQVLVLYSLNFNIIKSKRYIKIVLFKTKWFKIILLLQFS